MALVRLAILRTGGQVQSWCEGRASDWLLFLLLSLAIPTIWPGSFLAIANECGAEVQWKLEKNVSAGFIRTLNTPPLATPGEERRSVGFGGFLQ